MTCNKENCKHCDKCIKLKRKNKDGKKAESKNIKPNFVWKKA